MEIGAEADEKKKTKINNGYSGSSSIAAAKVMA